MDILRFDGSQPLGAPRDWDEATNGPCASLPVCLAYEPDGVTPVWYSLWKPEPAEIIALMGGAAIRLGIVGASHPVVSMTVLDAGVIEEVNARPIT